MGSIQSLTNHSESSQQAHKMSNYYRLHAKIYDLTRWAFLFGRECILDWLLLSMPNRPHIVEIGCGTGRNLKALTKKLPRAKLTGIDISADMLDIADRKLLEAPHYIALQQKNYATEKVYFQQVPDCILFSYCLTMVNPNWEKLIIQAKNDLNTEGVIAVVDFHQSSAKWFQRWMWFNHVRMDGHILPILQEHFTTVKLERRRAYFGLWHYFLFIGKIKK